jgi:hypothetical protein
MAILFARCNDEKKFHCLGDSRAPCDGIILFNWVGAVVRLTDVPAAATLSENRLSENRH